MPALSAPTLLRAPAATPPSALTPSRRLLPGQGALPRRLPAPPGSAAFVVDVRHDLLRPLVRVSGELDVASAPLLAAVLEHVRHTQPAPADDASRCVEVDLSQVSFADSAGLAPVLDGRTVVLAASDPVRRVLHLLQPHPAPTVPPTSTFGGRVNPAADQAWHRAAPDLTPPGAAAYRTGRRDLPATTPCPPGLTPLGGRRDGPARSTS